MNTLLTMKGHTMKTKQFALTGIVCGSLLLSASAWAAGVISPSNHQGVGPNLDVDPAKTYLHTLDFPSDGTGATVNGVVFSPVPGGAGTDPLTGNPYTLVMNLPTTFAGDGLLGDFLYNGSQPVGAVLEHALGGLVPGTTYDVRLYYRAFGPRAQDTTIDTDGVPGAEWAGVMDQDTAQAENYWSIVFQADTPTVTIRFAQQVFNASWHMYGTSTEVVPAAPGVPVTITTQPGSQTAREGGAAAFRVAATGSTPMTFQWRKNGEPILNATNMVLSVPNVAPGDAASYDVVVANGLPETATSDAATLAVGPAADFTVSKVAGVTVTGIPGRTAQILVSDQLGAAAVWAPLTNVVLSSGTLMVPDPAMTSLPVRFYRGVLLP
jgi:hypothetical protein